MSRRHSAAVAVLCATLPLAACATAENSPDAEPAGAAAAEVHTIGWPWADTHTEPAAAAVADVHTIGWPLG